jgi:hypothetical protein
LLTAPNLCEDDDMQAFVKLINSHHKIIVRALVIVLLLAPIVNLVLSFSGSGVANWYKFNILLPFLKSILWVDYLCLLGFVLAALVLLLNKVYSYYISGAIVSIVTVLGVTRVFGSGASSITEFYLMAYSIGGVVLNISIVAVLVLLAQQRKLS